MVGSSEDLMTQAGWHEESKGQDAAESISSKPTCAMCSSSSFVESLLPCDGCPKQHHTFCLSPPLVSIPERWLCPSCASRATATTKRKRTATATATATAQRKRKRAGAAVGTTSLSPGVASLGAHGMHGVPNGAIDRSMPNGVRRGRASTSRSWKHSEESPPPAAAATASVALAWPEDGDEDEGKPKRTSGQVPHPESCQSDAKQDSSSDPGTTITIFCRRDYRRYLRWKRRELANQDHEKKREEQTRARKTFSSIIATSRR